MQGRARLGGFMADDPKDETYSHKETVERREAALKRMLATPHKKHRPLAKRKGAAR